MEDARPLFAVATGEPFGARRQALVLRFMETQTVRVRQRR